MVVRANGNSCLYKKGLKEITNQVSTGLNYVIGLSCKCVNGEHDFTIYLHKDGNSNF